jgi:hypothetical protein
VSFPRIVAVQAWNADHKMAFSRRGT